MSNFESPVGEEQSTEVSENNSGNNSELSLEQKRQEAETVVLEIFSEKLQTPMENSFEIGGRKYDNLTCIGDCLVSRAQHAVSVAQEVLDQVRADGDYHKEKVAAQLLSLLKARESFFKEIASLPTELVKKLLEQLPEVRVILEGGENDNAINKANKENVANDNEEDVEYIQKAA